MKRILVALLIVFSVASGALSYSLFRTNSELRSALANQKKGLTPNNVAQSENSIRGEMPQAQKTQDEESVQEKKAEPAVAQNWQERRMRFFKQMLENPERRQMFIDANKGRIERGYAPLFKKLKLSEEEAGVFMSLLSERTLYQRGLRYMSDAMSDEEKAVTQANLDQLDVGLAELLGDEGFDTYEVYNETRSQRQMVENLNQKLSYAGTPLSDETTENLISMMAAQEKAFSFTNNLSDTGPRNWGEYSQEDIEIYLREKNELNAQILDGAGEILSEDQLDSLLEQQLEESDRIQRWSTIRAQGGFGPPPR